MNKPKFCVECKWSKVDTDSPWTLKCIEPSVNATNAWSLSSSKIEGTSCHWERDKSWPWGPCGRRGARWEQL